MEDGLALRIVGWSHEEEVVKWRLLEAEVANLLPPERLIRAFAERCLENVVDANLDKDGVCIPLPFDQILAAKCRPDHVPPVIHRDFVRRNRMALGSLLGAVAKEGVLLNRAEYCKVTLSALNDAKTAIRKALKIARDEQNLLTVFEPVLRSVASPRDKSPEDERHRAQWVRHRDNLAALDRGLKATHDLITEYGTVRIQCDRKTQTGPRKEIWKRIFVSVLARVWFGVTGAKPPSNPDSAFHEFVVAVWACVDENDQFRINSWDRTIREVSKSYSQLLSKNQ